MQESIHKMLKSASHQCFLVGCRSHFVPFAEHKHLTALRAWCTRCLPGRRKPDVLHPGIVGYARVHGRSTIRLCMKRVPPPPAQGLVYLIPNTRYDTGTYLSYFKVKRLFAVLLAVHHTFALIDTTSASMLGRLRTPAIPLWALATRLSFN